MREVQIGEHQFVIGNLDPKRAFHVIRRIAPLLGSMRDFIPYVSEERSFDPDNLEDLAGLLEPLAKALSEMPDADADYVIDTCLSVVSVKLPGGASASIQAGSHLMYDWITMPMMIRLVFETVMANLQGFLPAGASAS